MSPAVSGCYWIQSPAPRTPSSVAARLRRRAWAAKQQKAARFNGISGDRRTPSQQQHEKNDRDEHHDRQRDAQRPEQRPRQDSSIRPHNLMMTAEPCRYGAPGGDSGPEPRSSGGGAACTSRTRMETTSSRRPAATAWSSRTPVLGAFEGGGLQGQDPLGRSTPLPIPGYPRNRGPRRGSICEEKEKGDDPPYAYERKLHSEH